VPNAEQPRKDSEETETAISSTRIFFYPYNQLIPGLSTQKGSESIFRLNEVEIALAGFAGFELVFFSKISLPPLEQMGVK
jgi:hypothetical protein